MNTKESTLTIGQQKALALKLACVISEHLMQVAAYTVKDLTSEVINQAVMDGASEAVRIVEMILSERER